MSAAAWESLHKATLELAKPTALKQRLTDAFTRHLIDLPTHDMPAEVRQDFDALRQSMTRIRGQHGECPVAATVRKMSIGEADACAARIVALLDTLHRSSLTAAAEATAARRPWHGGHGGVADPDADQRQSSLNSITSQRVVSS